MFSVDEAVSGAHKKQNKKNLLSQDCVRGMYVESTHPVMHMPCKKAKTPRSVFNPRTREKRKQKNIVVRS